MHNVLSLGVQVGEMARILERNEPRGQIALQIRGQCLATAVIVVTSNDENRAGDLEVFARPP